MSRCVVVIPVYKNELSADEENCVRRYVKILEGEDIFFIAPFKINKAWYEERFPKVKWKLYKDKFFTGTKAYNHLMLDIKFYDSFKEYEYMLIAQTDAVIWQNTNRLSEFMDKEYDYIGAPWIPERRIWEWSTHKKKGFPGFAIKCCKKKGQGITMGNGGFCLRNIAMSKALIKEFSWRKVYWFFKRNEDIFFGVFGRENKCGFKLADVDTGLLFAREYDLKKNVIDGNVPFGVHGWQKEFASYDDMETFLKENGVWDE